MTAGNGTRGLQRRSLIAQLMAQLTAHGGDALLVTGLGAPTYDVAAAGERDDICYLWGVMGLAVPTGLGLALAQPDRRVLVITGDGEMMMGIGSLAVVAAEAPANLAILVLDNEAFGETGQQAGLTSGRTDIAAMARGAGINETLLVTEERDIAGLAPFLLEGNGPRLAAAKVALTEDPLTLPTTDGALIARRFRAAVLGEEKR